MNQANAALNANLDVLVIVSLMILAVSLLLLVGAAWTLIPQTHRTLAAIQKLVTTVEVEIEPTLSEANRLLGGVLKWQNIAQESVSGMSTKVEDVTGNLTKVADTAKKHTSIWGAGIQAGIKAYLESSKERLRKEEAGKEEAGKEEAGKEEAGKEEAGKEEAGKEKAGQVKQLTKAEFGNSRSTKDQGEENGGSKWQIF